MPYVLVDLEGAVRGRYSSLVEAQQALRRIEATYPGLSSDLYVFIYADGSVVSDIRGDELLAAHETQESYLLEWSVSEPLPFTGHVGGATTTTGTRSIAPVLEPA